jgi:V-type H+-transporting ATPase subunit E
MVEFIKKEADEKAQEIKLKANEEYEIEKASIVRSETESIDSAYERKYKQAALSQQIAKSTLANKIRLKILGAKEDALQAILEEARSKLKGVSGDKATYEKVLAGLIEEGLYSLMDDKVVVRVRESDVAVAEKAVEQAAKQYEETAGKPVTIMVDKTNYLAADSAGGVIVVSDNGKIDVDNTLEERLKLLSESSLPAIRMAIFGPSASRKFFD